ncbi:MAG: tautomerase family protein [Burkholderiaceae bacterium]|jgi:phenylpyruvate tautomerase PptA (4-oxalocrotonate tautomerase family)|nr:tautomerase family protein [Burkholderiaceae bacterium]
MPSAIVEVRRRYTPEQEAYLLRSVHDAIVEAFKVSPVHRNVTLVVHEPHRFLGRTDCATPEWLTNVTLFALPGRSVDAKRRLYRLITDSFAAAGIPPACVLIRLNELQAENFGVRGGQALCDVELGYPIDV